ncbi:MAG: hypothetical protein R2909_02610 [Gemmatimonadales bacterium]
MAGLIGAVVLIMVAVWLLAGKQRPREVAPEDDVTTPIDLEELEAAERELEEDLEGRELDDGWDDDTDDWGPGTAR